LKRRDRLGIEARRAQQHLQRELLAGMHVLDPIHDAHAPSTERVEDLVAARDHAADRRNFRGSVR